MNNNFEKLIDYFISTKELGHYDESKNLICLYDVINSEKEIKRIKTEIEKITKKYKLILLELDKQSNCRNINILDIDV